MLMRIICKIECLNENSTNIDAAMMLIFQIRKKLKMSSYTYI